MLFSQSFLLSKLPKRTRRSILFASLTGYLSGDGDITKVQIINRELHLAKDPKSLTFPFLLAKKIWAKVPGIEDIKALFRRDDWDVEKVKKVASMILALIPDWLRYDKDKVIRRDIERMVKNHSVVC